MAKQFQIELSQKSIQDAINQIEAYKQSLTGKVDVFLSRLADIGLKVVQATMASISPEEKGSYWTEEVKRPPNGVAIVLGGDKVLFVEFGAGVIYSNPQNPKASELGYGVGTYPDQKYAWNMTKWGGGWWYTDDSGESHHSYGNPAYMPMYKAEVEILAQIRSVAREVFGGR